MIVKHNGEVLGIECICPDCKHQFIAPTYSEKYNKDGFHIFVNYVFKRISFEYCVVCPDCGSHEAYFDDIEVFKEHDWSKEYRFTARGEEIEEFEDSRRWFLTEESVKKRLEDLR